MSDRFKETLRALFNMPWGALVTALICLGTVLTGYVRLTTGFEGRITNLEDSIKAMSFRLGVLETKYDARMIEVRESSERIAKIEKDVEWIRASLIRIADKLDVTVSGERYRTNK